MHTLNCSVKHIPVIIFIRRRLKILRDIFKQFQISYRTFINSYIDRCYLIYPIMTKLIITDIICKQIVKSVCHNNAVRTEHQTVYLNSIGIISFCDKFTVFVVFSDSHIYLFLSFYSIFDRFYDKKNTLVIIMKNFIKTCLFAL